MNARTWIGLALFLTTVVIAAPTLLYGPDLLVTPDSASGGTIFDSLASFEINTPIKLTTSGERAFLMLCEGQLIELRPWCTAHIEPGASRLTIDKGGAFLHIEEPPGRLCYTVSADSAEIRYIGVDSVHVTDAVGGFWIQAGGRLRNGKVLTETESWPKKQSKDAAYVFRQYGKGNIPRHGFKFKFPSVVGPIFEHGTRGLGGVATYRDTTYYYGGGIYTARLWELEFAYDLWFAISKSGNYYGEAWDEWSDLVDHIRHIKLFTPRDPFYMRAGLIENVGYGKGLLVDGYNNAVFLPFEKKNGLQLQVKFKKFEGYYFLNDIGYPRVTAMHTVFKSDKRFVLTGTIAMDINQYSDIEDSDGDSYPDIADPQPDRFNQASDSIIIATSPPSLDDVGTKYLFGGAVGARTLLFKSGSFRGNLSGELAMLSNVGTGVSFPDFAFSYKWFRFGIGTDFQTPGFFAGVFDANYEADRGHVQLEDDGTYSIVSRRTELADTEGWLYGWNNSFSIAYPELFTFRSAFRDLYRDDTRDKKLNLSLENKYPFTEYLTSTQIFIEQKNVQQLLQKRTDGETWGFSIGIKPHHTMRLKVRYRERYTDDNLDGEIGDGETQRNINASLVIYGDYWFRKYIDWRRERKLAKAAAEIPIEPSPESSPVESPGG